MDFGGRGFPFEEDRGQSRFHMRLARRRRIIRTAVLAFAGLLVISLPFELVRYHDVSVLARHEVVLSSTRFHIGADPVFSFGPSGHSAAKAFGNGRAWINDVASRECEVIPKWVGEAPGIEVGFLEVVGNLPRAVLSIPCETSSGYDNIVAVIVAPSHKVLGTLIVAKSRLDEATITVTKSSAKLSGLVGVNDKGDSVARPGYSINLSVLGGAPSSG